MSRWFLCKRVLQRVGWQVELVGFVLGVAASTRDAHVNGYRDKLPSAVHDYRVPVVL